MSHSSTIILEGGLGNRMRAAVSAYAISHKTGLTSRVLWTSQWGMRCRFDSLFEPICLTGFELRDVSLCERIIYTRPTLSNLFLPHLLQSIRYKNHVMSSSEVFEKSCQNFDFETWLQSSDTLIHSYRDFFPWTPSELRLLFHPTTVVKNLIKTRTENFGTYTIGVHIRRSDHEMAIKESPIELFTQAIDDELDSHTDLIIYLATDDEATKVAMKQRYGHRVISSPNKATRDNTEGIQEALAEMFALSRTAKIYGSANSTFSQIAACLGDIKINILTRNGLGKINLLVTNTYLQSLSS